LGGKGREKEREKEREGERSTKVQLRRDVHEKERPYDEYDSSPEAEVTGAREMKLIFGSNLSRNLRYSDLSMCFAVEENSTTFTCTRAQRQRRRNESEQERPGPGTAG
jgi:hypothetical protein